MTEVDRIRNQFERAFEGDAWHGPPIVAALDGVTAAQAAAHPIPGAHSIWELTLHIAAWEEACRRRLGGDPAQLADSEDWRPITDTSEAAWERTKQELNDTHQRLMTALAAVDDSRLDQPIVESSYNMYVTLHGVVQHGLYHAGQIAMLKKAIESVAS